jgi:Beta-carotene isomerase D27-like, C-terminal
LFIPPFVPLRTRHSGPHITTTTTARRAAARSQEVNSDIENINGSSSSNNTNRAASSAVAVSSASFYDMAVPGPPLETKPDYENIVGPLGRWMDSLFMTVFRHQLEYYSSTTTTLHNAASRNDNNNSQQQQQQSPQPRPLFSVHDEYQSIIDLAATMNRAYTNRTEIHVRAQRVLNSLFPSWMPSSYAILFSKPFPAFSARMNAWATYVAGTWLMGECEINNVAIDGDCENMDSNEQVVVSGIGQGLLVKRCRFLEESGCASICVNSCKIPTQKYVSTMRACFYSYHTDVALSFFGGGLGLTFCHCPFYFSYSFYAS